MRRVELDGRIVDIPVRLSRQSRRLKLVVDGQRHAEIVAPLRTSQRAIDALLREHRGWLERELAKPPRPLRLGLQRDDVVWLGGVPHPKPRVPSLERWYRERARERLDAATAEEGARLGIGYRSVVVRGQRTRWGSCSPTGVLSFNWRLVLAPPHALRYVVVHELCHRLRHDHSPAFWRLVEDALPRHRDPRVWLDEHGHELLAYSVPG